MTTIALNIKVIEVENKIPDHVKYITTQEFNNLSAGNLVARLTQANLVTKTDFDNKLISFNKNITSDKTKYLEILIGKDDNFFLGRMFLQVMMDLKTRLLINQQLSP